AKEAPPCAKEYAGRLECTEEGPTSSNRAKEGAEVFTRHVKPEAKSFGLGLQYIATKNQYVFRRAI
ncbi:MAG: hypothetical protein Q4D34_05430, partial [Eggerthellaceae bacterium]|nr:hypothetical protein [Eggerthellaceae bacterium]